MARVLRKRTRVCYYEPEEPSFDEYIYCTSCRDYVYEYCSIHGPLLVIPDDKVSSPTGYPPIVPRAALTIPKVFLHLAESEIPGAGIGVFSTLTLPVGVRFGPYRGARTQDASSRYCWQIFDREHKPLCLVDAGDADGSNWMRYVNCSRHDAEQNLVAYQYQGRIYYRTIKIVPRFTELLVFYGSEFALALDVDLRQYRAPRRGPQTNGQDHKLDENENIPISSDNEERKDKFSEKIHGRTPEQGIGDGNESEDVVCKKSKPTSNRQGIQQINDDKSKNVVDSKTYMCDDCGRSYKEKASLIFHISTHKFKEDVKIKATSIGILRYPCETCDSKFINKSELINHNIKVHNSKIKYKACDYCNYKTQESSKLKRHMRIHTGSKPYQCEVCDSTFTQQNTLKRHSRIHTGEKPYQCTVCYSKFSYSGTLKNHLRSHSGEKPYQCTVCDSKFVRRSDLKRHLRVHTGEKPYHCSVCDSKFSESGYLKSHLRIHSGEKPYQCIVCDTKFRVSGQLKRHLRTHTGEKL